MQQKTASKSTLLRKLIRPSLILLGIALVTLAILVLVISLLSNYYRGLVLPFTTYGDVSLGGKTKDDAQEMILSRLEELKEQTIVIKNADTLASFMPEQLGIEFSDPQASLDDLAIYTNDAPLSSLLKSVWRPNIIPVHLKTNQDQALTALKALFNEVDYFENAYFKYTPDGGLIINPEHNGVDIDWQNMRPALITALLENVHVDLQLMNAVPTLTASDLMANQERLLPKLQRPITLAKAATAFTVPAEEIVKMARFEHIAPKSDPSNELKITLDSKLWASYETEHLAPIINREASPISLKLEGDRVGFSGSGQDGEIIDSLKLYQDLVEKLNTPDANEPLSVATVVVPAEISIDEALKAQGVSGLIASGYTSYYGSPANRTHNVAIGLQKFNGLIIQPGETFSFNENLGPVEAYTGYLPELVIKPEGTVPEYGGGLCQVSTTLYRAVLNANLPVVDRRPHSYAVSYYAQQLGHGLDATIYPGASDLRFENTTGGIIVIQSYNDGQQAYFKLYGKPQNISVSYDGPYISNHISAPAPIKILDNNLPAGASKQVEKAHNGFDVVWYKVTKFEDGHTEREEIFSRYKAIPAKYLVGPEAVPTTNDITLDPASTAVTF